MRLVSGASVTDPERPTTAAFRARRVCSMLGGLKSVQGKTSLYKAARTLREPVSSIHRGFAPQPQSGLRKPSGASVSSLWGKRQHRLHVAHSASGAAAQAASEPTAGASDLGPVVQYVVVRKDLKEGMGWPLVRGRSELFSQPDGRAAACARAQRRSSPACDAPRSPPAAPSPCLASRRGASSRRRATPASRPSGRTGTTPPQASTAPPTRSTRCTRRAAVPRPGLPGSFCYLRRGVPAPRSAVAVLASSELLRRALKSGAAAPLLTPLRTVQVVVLEIKGEAQLRTLAEKLSEAGVAFKLWTGQPENFPTCLATKPYHKGEVQAAALQKAEPGQVRGGAWGGGALGSRSRWWWN